MGGSSNPVCNGHGAGDVTVITFPIGATRAFTNGRERLKSCVPALPRVQPPPYAAL